MTNPLEVRPANVDLAVPRQGVVVRRWRVRRERSPRRLTDAFEQKFEHAYSKPRVRQDRNDGHRTAEISPRAQSIGNLTSQKGHTMTVWPPPRPAAGARTAVNLAR